MSDAVRSVAELRERYMQARLARGWSRARAGALVGVSPQTVKRFELGATTPPAGTILRLLASVGLDLVVCERAAARRSA